MQCVNCNQTYVLEGKKQRLPLLLNCSHSYCSVCISTFFKKVQSDAIPCPECRVPTPLLPSTPILHQLPLCVYSIGRIRVEQLGLTQDRGHHSNAASAEPSCIPKLDELVDDEEEEENKEEENEEEDKEDYKLRIIRSLECEECELKMAEVKCEKCEALFCTNCFEIVHLSSKILRSHKGIQLDGGDVPENFKELIKNGKKKAVLLNKLRTCSKHNQDEINQQLIALKNIQTSYHQKLETEFHKIRKAYEDKKSSSVKNWLSIIKEATKVEKQINSVISKAPHLNPEDFRQDLEKMIDKANELLTAGNSVSQEIIKITKTGLPLDIDLSKHLMVEQVWEALTVVTPSTPSSDSERESTSCSVTPSKNKDYLTPSIPRYSKSPSSRSSSNSSRDTSSSRGASPLSEHMSPSKEDLQNVVGCVVTHVESPSEFWVILDKEESKLATLNKFLLKHCESHSETAAMKPGTICAVKDKKGNWRRALIEQVIWDNPSYLYVYYLDDGGATCMTAMSNSRSIPEKWQSIEPLAHRCCLSGIQPVSRMSNVVPNDWSQNCNSYLRSIVLDQTGIKLRVISKDRCIHTNTETLLVDLYLPSKKSVNGISVIQQLVTQGKASKIKENPLVPNDLPVGPVPPVGHRIEVEMITADSPNDFYVLNSQNNDPALNRVSDIISTHISSKPVKVTPSRLVVGALVLAPYEDEYYRAKILDIQSKDGVCVRYLDYGNVSVVNVAEIYEITKKLIKIPPVSYHCCLSNSVDQWPETVSNKFYQITEGEKLIMTVTGAIKNGVLPVGLQFQNSKKDIGKILENLLPPTTSSSSREETPPHSISVKKDKACPPPAKLPSLGYNGPVIIKNVSSTTDFHVILAEDVQVFDSIEAHPPNSNVLEPFHPTTGTYCHALFGTNYHRAVVQSVDSVSCMVYYIDYGNTESVPVKNLLPLPEPLLKEPALAIPCRLHGIENVTEFDYSHNVKFYNLVFEKKVIALVKEVVESDPTPHIVVSLMIKGVIGLEDVLKLCITPSSPSVVTSMATPTSIETSMTTPISMATPTSMASSLSKSPSPRMLPNHFLSELTMAGTNSPPSVVPPPGLSKFTYSKPEYPSVEEFKVMVTFVTPDKIIYGQPLLHAQLFEKVHDSISIFTKLPRPVSSLNMLSKGQGCIAMFEEDQQWYRGIIENITDDHADVFFIDYGNRAQCPPHAIINKMACPSIPRLAISFSEHKHLELEKLSGLLDKEVTVKQVNGNGNTYELVLDELSPSSYKFSD